MMPNRIALFIFIYSFVELRRTGNKRLPAYEGVYGVVTTIDLCVVAHPSSFLAKLARFRQPRSQISFLPPRGLFTLFFRLSAPSLAKSQSCRVDPANWAIFATLTIYVARVKRFRLAIWGIF
jgi:hypothetical protein